MARQGAGLQVSIGERVHRVRLQNPGERVRDSDGEWSAPWFDLNPPTLDMALRVPTTDDLERAGSGTVITMSTYLMIGPYHPQVTTQTRLLTDDGRSLSVLGVSSLDGRRIEMRLLVAEDVP